METTTQQTTQTNQPKAALDLQMPKANGACCESASDCVCGGTHCRTHGHTQGRWGHD